jgi:hypothetical protein
MSSDRKPALKNNQRKSIEPADLEELWAKHGARAIELVRTHDPSAYLQAIARLIRD